MAIKAVTKKGITKKGIFTSLSYFYMYLDKTF